MFITLLTSARKYFYYTMNEEAWGWGREEWNIIFFL